MLTLTLDGLQGWGDNTKCTPGPPLSVLLDSVLIPKCVSTLACLFQLPAINIFHEVVLIHAHRLHIVLIWHFSSWKHFTDISQLIVISQCGTWIGSQSNHLRDGNESFFTSSTHCFIFIVLWRNGCIICPKSQKAWNCSWDSGLVW